MLFLSTWDSTDAWKGANGSQQMKFIGINSGRVAPVGTSRDTFGFAPVKGARLFAD